MRKLMLLTLVLLAGCEGKYQLEGRWAEEGYQFDAETKLIVGWRAHSRYLTRGGCEKALAKAFYEYPIYDFRCVALP